MKKTLLSSLIIGAMLSMNAYAENLPAKTPTPTANATPAAAATQNKNAAASTQAKSAKANTARTQRAAANTSNNQTAATSNRQTVTVQMGAFTDPNLAYKQAAKASLLGLPARVVHMKNRNGDVVRVVRSSTRLKQADAEKIAADLREQQVNVLLMQ